MEWLAANDVRSCTMIVTDVSISAMAAIDGRLCIDCDWCVSISAMAALDGRSRIDSDLYEHLRDGRY